MPTQTNSIIVGGSYTIVGSVSCEAICAWDTQAKQWQELGAGIKGQVTAVAYAGDDQKTLIVGGTIVLADSTTSNVAEYSLANSTWTAPGGGQGIPGSVSALEVNNGNSSSIFAAGQLADGTPFLVFYNGHFWQTLSACGERQTAVPFTVVQAQRFLHRRPSRSCRWCPWLTSTRRMTSLRQIVCCLYLAHCHRHRSEMLRRFSSMDNRTILTSRPLRQMASQVLYHHYSTPSPLSVSILEVSIDLKSSPFSRIKQHSLPQV